MLNGEPRGFLNRLVWALVGLSAISMGVVPYLRRGEMLYTNWFGEPVFIPVALLGGFIIGCAVLKPA